jgi:uncharacterized protein YbaP (TraB family)
MRNILRPLFLALVALGLSINAAGATQEAPPVLASIKAHPALWTVRSDNAAAYLFGSIHLLPPNIDWHSKAVDAALAASDVFVFEAPLDEAGQEQTVTFVRSNGMLPPNEVLPQLLDRRARRDFRAAVLAAHVAPESLIHFRPWLAAIVLETRLLEASHYSADSGVDRQIWAVARAQGKAVRTFETVDEQLTLLMPKDKKLEMEEFDASLKELRTDSGEIGALVDAWCDGRMSEVARLMNAGLADTPGAMKLLIDDRNVRWRDRMAAMLSEHHTYFVTVGAGHLAGPRGLPALLAARGFHVELSPPSP